MQKPKSRWSISFPMIALAIPITILFQNCSPQELNSKNAVVRSKSEATKAAWADFKSE